MKLKDIFHKKVEKTVRTVVNKTAPIVKKEVKKTVDVVANDTFHTAVTAATVVGIAAVAIALYSPSASAGMKMADTGLSIVIHELSITNNYYRALA